MLEKLNEKDQKTLKMGGLAVLVLAVAITGYLGYNHWTAQNKLTKKLNADFKKLVMNESAYKKLLSEVPVFQPPEDDSTQKTKFRDFLDQQFERRRITTEAWVEVTAGNAIRPPAGYGVLSLKTSSKGTVSFQNILNLLADLKENPYYAGIEELKITCDQQNPQLATLSIVLATFTDNRNIKRAK